jgi:peptide/nickel transport system permease protein
MRLIPNLITLWLAFTLVFLMMRLLPGDAISAQLVESGASPALIAQRRAELGLDASLLVQYLRYTVQFIQGQWGVSLARGVEVSTLIGQALPYTLALSGGALAVGIVMGVGLGLLNSLHVNTASGLAGIVISLALSTPIYWTAIAAIGVFSAGLNWLPAFGSSTPAHLVLPVLVLGFHTAGGIARITSSTVSETLNADYIRTAAAKGLSQRTVLLRHIMRAAAVPIFAVITVQASFLIGGSVIVETVFLRPGIGRVLLDAVMRRDYVVVQAVVVVSGVGVVIIQIMGDLLSYALDPRIRYRAGH